MISPHTIFRRRIHGGYLSVELCSRQEIPSPNPRLIIKNESSDKNFSGEDSCIDVKEASLNPASSPLIYKKPQRVEMVHGINRRVRPSRFAPS